MKSEVPPEGHSTLESLSAEAAAEVVRFRLYVSAVSPLSARAIVNARQFLNAHLPGAYELNVLDIATHVADAKRDQVIASPTLVRYAPLPSRRVVGDLSDVARMRDWFCLQPPASP
ncbi:circadian clock KaiB family protein [Diaphorobacter caeni]|uniref:circadian clock KaiB family protein n=1 Tax=Diaphorobacter caeni TaxID=2784387 RepID=UPI00188F009A|nr:circadian clock KaiB family protein [Diaphorobacter caeni]MBF5005868.1 circadian clock protein KaiB [Diaphorobacter caeni]